MIADILSRLDKVRQTGKGTWIARCPAHDDKGPSLSLREVEDGRVLLHCFAECLPVDVLTSLGLDWSAAFEPRENLKSLRRSFPAADVLECLAAESTIVLLAAASIRARETLTDERMARLVKAVSRIEEGRRLANG